MLNKLHEANRKRWDAGAADWAKKADSRGLWRRCPEEPELVLSPNELKYLREISGKRAAVLGSGDNQVTFALAGLGAQVTSVDISDEQLAVGERRARELGLNVEFVRADVTDLSELASGHFDVVYTGGHVAVWVSDLDKYYAESARILKTGGLLLIAEYHPFRRIWKESKDRLVVEMPYFERGPFEYFMDDDILEPKPGDLKSYEFHWTMSDFVNAVVKGGCNIVEMDEFGTYVGDWEGAPMDGLPEFFLIVARKDQG